MEQNKLYYFIASQHIEDIKHMIYVDPELIYVSKNVNEIVKYYFSNGYILQPWIYIFMSENDPLLINSNNYKICKYCRITMRSLDSLFLETNLNNTYEIYNILLNYCSLLNKRITKIINEYFDTFKNDCCALKSKDILYILTSYTINYNIKYNIDNDIITTRKHRLVSRCILM